MEQLPADTDRTVCQREDTGLLRGKTLPWKNTHMGLPEGNQAIWTHGGNTSCGVSPHPQGAWLALGLVHQGDGIHYLVGQPLLSEPSLSADL